MILHPGVSLIDAILVCNRVPEDEREQYTVFTGQPYNMEDAAISAVSAPGVKWTIMDDERTPIAIGGFVPLRPGVLQDWMHSTPLAWDRHGRAVTRLCRRVMDELLRTDAHRLQCVSLRSRTAAHRWYGALGLELEGTLCGYGTNGEDALIFSRVRVG